MTYIKNPPTPKKAKNHPKNVWKFYFKCFPLYLPKNLSNSYRRMTARFSLYSVCTLLESLGHLTLMIIRGNINKGVSDSYWFRNYECTCTCPCKIRTGILVGSHWSPGEILADGVFIPGRNLSRLPARKQNSCLPKSRQLDPVTNLLAEEQQSWQPKRSGNPVT